MVYHGWCEKHQRRMTMGHHGEGRCSQCDKEERDRQIWERDWEIRSARPLFYSRMMKKSSWPHLKILMISDSDREITGYA